MLLSACSALALEPTATSTPTDPVPSEYRDTLAATMFAMTVTFERFFSLNRMAANDATITLDSAWISEMNIVLDEFTNSANAIDAIIDIPKPYEDVHMEAKRVASEIRLFVLR